MLLYILIKYIILKHIISYYTLIPRLLYMDYTSFYKIIYIYIVYFSYSNLNNFFLKKIDG